MRYSILIICTLLVQGFFISCESSDSKMNRLIAERDSLKAESTTRAQDLKVYEKTLDLMNSTLDSISYREDIIFAKKGDKAPTREDIKQNLQKFEAVISQQQKKIAKLEQELAAGKESSTQAQHLIDHLKTQINLKNAQIARLKAEIADKNISIAELQSHVNSQNQTIQQQSSTISELNNRNRKQGEALSRQDAILNNAYVLIGSKSDLKRKGIVCRGRIVSNAALDRSKFYKVDIRKWREIQFKAKRPKILTNMPSTSYELTTSGDRNFTLRVKNASDFWRISNYLVIQTD